MLWQNIKNHLQLQMILLGTTDNNYLTRLEAPRTVSGLSMTISVVT